MDDQLRNPLRKQIAGALVFPLCLLLASGQNINSSSSIQPFSAVSVSEDLINKAEQLTEAKDYVGALKALDDALRFAPNDARGYLDIALRMQASGNIPEANKNFTLAVRRFPKLMLIFSDSGFARTAAKDYLGAIQNFNVAINLVPTMYFNYSGRAEARWGLEDYEGAIEDYSVQINAGIPDLLERVYLKRGRARLILDDLTRAAEDFAAAIKRKPDYQSAYLYLGVVLHIQGQLDSALNCLNKAIELRPDKASAYNSRCWIHNDLGNFAAALDDANKCITLEPASSHYVMYRAALYQQNGRLKEAELDYLQAIAAAEKAKDNESWYYSNFHLDLMRRQTKQSSSSHYLDDVLDWPDSWPKRLGLFLSNTISDEILLRDAIHAVRLPERKRQECEAYYFIAVQNLATGDEQAGRTRLEQCIETKQTQMVEHSLARLQLRHLREKY